MDEGVFAIYEFKFWRNTLYWNSSIDTKIHDAAKPVYNDHLVGYFSAFWGSSRWPRAN